MQGDKRLGKVCVCEDGKVVEHEKSGCVLREEGGSNSEHRSLANQ